MAASAHGDTPPALPMVEAVPIEKPQPMYTPCTAPPTIPLPCDGPRFTGYLSTDGSSTSTHAPTAAPPAAEGGALCPGARALACSRGRRVHGPPGRFLPPCGGRGRARACARGPRGPEGSIFLRNQ